MQAQTSWFGFTIVIFIQSASDSYDREAMRQDQVCPKRGARGIYFQEPPPHPVLNFLDRAVLNQQEQAWRTGGIHIYRQTSELLFAQWVWGASRSEDCTLPFGLANQFNEELFRLAQLHG